MAKVAAGDRDAFAALYDQFCKPLHSLAYRILQEPADAEEIVQEVFMKLWTRAPEFNARKGNPFSWAMAMTRNRCIDRIRSYSRRNQLSDTFKEDIASFSLSSQSADGLDKAWISERRELVREAVKTLPEDQRLTLELAYFKGLTQKEIAQQLSQPLGTVKARARRALIKLRELLEVAR